MPSISGRGLALPGVLSVPHLLSPPSCASYISSAFALITLRGVCPALSLALTVQQSSGSQLLGEALAAGAAVVGREVGQKNEKGPINSSTTISPAYSLADELVKHQMTARQKVSCC